VRQDGGQQLIGLRAVIGAGRFEQRDGFGHGAALRVRTFQLDNPSQQIIWSRIQKLTLAVKS
jgi:hypothetical protein